MILIHTYTQVDTLMSSSSIKELQARIAALQGDIARTESELQQARTQARDEIEQTRARAAYDIEQARTREEALKAEISREKAQIQITETSLYEVKTQGEDLMCKLNDQKIVIDNLRKTEKELAKRLEQTNTLLSESQVWNVCVCVCVF
jgi:uncharacterized small protein (DUF1192 family)